MLATCPTSQELISHPTIRAAVQALLLESCRRVRLAVASSIRIEEGQEPQVLHRDDTEWPVYSLANIRPGKEIEVSAMWAVTDFNESNGATCVVMGIIR